MIESEREMVRKLSHPPPKELPFTSLQPTYEDTVAPDSDDWGQDHEAS